MKVRLIAVTVSALGGCVAATATNSGGEDSKTLFLRLRKCAEASVADLDDGVSDAKTIALALSQKCHVEYRVWICALADERLSNDEQKQMFLWRRSSSESRAEALLPIVLEHRRRLRP